MNSELFGTHLFIPKMPNITFISIINNLEKIFNNRMVTNYFNLNLRQLYCLGIKLRITHYELRIKKIFSKHLKNKNLWCII